MSLPPVFGRLVAHAGARAALLPTVTAATAPAAPRPSFVEAIAGRDRLSVIAEFKRASPSSGAFAGHDLRTTVAAYATAGAAAISVLTEDSRFGGSPYDLSVAAEVAAATPLLRKDFVVDVRQVHEARALGASAVLLIARCLDGAALHDLVQAAAAAGLTPLIECADAAEVERALAFADAVIGINNRDLDTLRVDQRRALRLLPLVPPGRIAVAESGYRGGDDLRPLRGLADAVLVGSALMRQPSPGAALRALLAAAQEAVP